MSSLLAPHVQKHACEQTSMDMHQGFFHTIKFSLFGPNSHPTHTHHRPRFRVAPRPRHASSVWFRANVRGERRIFAPRIAVFLRRFCFAITELHLLVLRSKGSSNFLPCIITPIHEAPQNDPQLTSLVPARLPSHPLFPSLHRV